MFCEGQVSNLPKASSVHDWFITVACSMHNPPYAAEITRENWSLLMCFLEEIIETTKQVNMQ